MTKFRVYREITGNMTTLEYVVSFHSREAAESFCVRHNAKDIYTYFIAE
jgi:hypothetical protein